MSKRYAPRYCSECGTILPNTSKAYAELDKGWAVQHSSGGAHNVHYPEFTGRVLCALHFDLQRPKDRGRVLLPPTCGDCGGTPVKFRQLVYAWTQLPATKSVHDPRYGPLHLCQKCWLMRMEGEQLALWDA